MATKLYTSQFVKIIPSIFKNNTHFLRAFGGTVQTVDGIRNTDEFMTIKVSDAEAVIQEYSTDANVAFGTGTGSSSRFGPMKEIISVDKSLPYDAPLAINEGVDYTTVNDVPEQVVAERLEKQAEAWATHVDEQLATLIASTSGIEKGTGDVKTLFANARKHFVNNKVNRLNEWVAYVTPDVYNALLESGLLTTAKNSATNIDEGEVKKTYGFIVEEVDEVLMTKTGADAVFLPANFGVVGLGVNVSRTLESADFAGVAIQSMAKYGKYVPENNVKAAYAGTLEVTPEVTPEA